MLTVGDGQLCFSTLFYFQIFHSEQVLLLYLRKIIKTLNETSEMDEHFYEMSFILALQLPEKAHFLSGSPG